KIKYTRGEYSGKFVIFNDTRELIDFIKKAFDRKKNLPQVESRILKEEDKAEIRSDSIFTIGKNNAGNYDMQIRSNWDSAYKTQFQTVTDAINFLGSIQSSTNKNSTKPDEIKNFIYSSGKIELSEDELNQMIKSQYLVYAIEMISDGTFMLWTINPNNNCYKILNYFIFAMILY
ncbi:hypothetical protein, partial [uncultured Methanobrevibacter sp.]|uniref:hypothetical protein n=1 Tax=uncultured Methanobrevibacter sp. TaxID=253161 RepID=UPI002611AFC4